MKTGIVFGAFDLLHLGHIHLLHKCREQCDCLVVGLHVDPSIERTEKNKPIETVYERFMKLRELDIVDKIVPYETEEDLKNILRSGNIDVRFLGTDYRQEKKKITEEELVPIVYIDSLPVHTSTIRERIIK